MTVSSGGLPGAVSKASQGGVSPQRTQRPPRHFAWRRERSLPSDFSARRDSMCSSRQPKRVTVLCARLCGCALLAVALLFGLMIQVGSAESWVFQPSYFSHDQQGERIAQFAPEPQKAAPYDPTYSTSAYRHTRSSLRGADGSFDHSHIVRTWGRGEYLRPYGEWQFPYRAGATPYGPWGNPQGPWTTPFGSWVNPYGLGRLPWGWWGPRPPAGIGAPGHPGRAPSRGAHRPGSGSAPGPHTGRGGGLRQSP